MYAQAQTKYTNMQTNHMCALSLPQGTNTSQKYTQAVGTITSTSLGDSNCTYMLVMAQKAKQS